MIVGVRWIVRGVRTGRTLKGGFRSSKTAVLWAQRSGRQRRLEIMLSGVGLMERDEGVIKSDHGIG